VKILAVDISHIFRVNWEASEGKEYSAAFNRTISQVAAQRVGYDRVVLACDSGPSFRKQIPEYKADRTDPGDAYRSQLARTIERLKADGCVALVAPKVGEFPATKAPSHAEADDVMAWIADQYGQEVDKLPEGDPGREAWHLTILSGDGDMEQLIDDGASIDVQKPEKDGKRWNEAMVLAKREVTVDKIRDLKALAGDKSDNYKPFPGILEPGAAKRGPGIGDGSAAKLIQIFGGALAVFDDLDRKGADDKPVINPHLRKLLDLHGKRAAEVGMFLATVVSNLPDLDWATVMAEPVTSPIVTTPDYFVEPAPEPAAIPDASFEQSPVATTSSTALARITIASPIDIYGLQPRTMSETEAIAKIVMESKAYGFANKEQVIMCIIEARERGTPVGAALRAAYNVRGKLAWSASYLAALVLSSGKADYFEIVETTSQKAVVAYKRVGRPGDKFPFTIDEARDAGWCRSGQNGDSKWITNPRTMLRWAAIRESARAFFSDVVSGIYTPDELNGDIRPAEFESEAA
jgi:5'-3' exonuclease